MDRGLRARLSSNEETALHRIAAGSDGSGIPSAHLSRLAALWLVQSRDGRWELTDYGTLRATTENFDRGIVPSRAASSADAAWVVDRLECDQQVRLGRRQPSSLGDCRRRQTCRAGRYTGGQ